MNYEQFKEEFIDAVKEQLAEQGLDMNVSVNEVKKLNESYEAMTVTPEGARVGVNVSLERFYEAYDEGRPMSEVVDKAVETVTHGIEQRPDFDIDSLMDYDQMKGKLAIEIVSAEANKEILENVPHKNMEDMAVVYRFVLNSEEQGRASVLVTNQMLDTMGITAEQLHKDAMEIAPQLNPAEIRGMSEVMVEMMGPEQAEMMGITPVAPEDEQLFVATVPDKTHGASVLAYQNFMDQAAERVGGDFYILPSSIHEILIVPDNGRMQLKELEAMVRDVNATQVAPCDKLTDNVYHYSAQEKIFELGEKFVERQQEREEHTAEREEKTAERENNTPERDDHASEPVEHATEREEKASVLADLQAKKEEVAKIPKKEHIEKGARSKDETSL